MLMFCLPLAQIAGYNKNVSLASKTSNAEFTSFQRHFNCEDIWRIFLLQHGSLVTIFTQQFQRRDLKMSDGFKQVSRLSKICKPLIWKWKQKREHTSDYYSKNSGSNQRAALQSLMNIYNNLNNTFTFIWKSKWVLQIIWFKTAWSHCLATSQWR